MTAQIFAIRKFSLVTTNLLYILLITTFMTSVCSTANVQQQQQIQGRENNTKLRVRCVCTSVLTK